METKIHIGQIIRTAVKNRKITVTEFARRINCTTRNVYKIFDKESVDTGLLEKINKALDQNFFIHYLSKEDADKLCKEKSDGASLIAQPNTKANSYKLHETTLTHERARV